MSWWQAEYFKLQHESIKEWSTAPQRCLTEGLTKKQISSDMRATGAWAALIFGKKKLTDYWVPVIL